MDKNRYSLNWTVFFGNFPFFSEFFTLYRVWELKIRASNSWSTFIQYSRWALSWFDPKNSLLIKIDSLLTNNANLFAKIKLLSSQNCPKLDGFTQSKPTHLGSFFSHENVLFVPKMNKFAERSIGNWYELPPLRRWLHSKLHSFNKLCLGFRMSVLNT